MPVPSVFPQWAQDINTFLGLVGFIITVYVLIEVRSIKRSFMSRARLPEIVQALERAGSDLNANLSNWPSRRNEARSQVKIAASLLKSVATFLPKGEREEALRVHHKLNIAAQTFDDPIFNKAGRVWDLYSDIQSIITTLTQVSKNLSWE